MNTAEDLVFVRWKRRGNTVWCRKAHLQVIDPHSPRSFSQAFSVLVVRQSRAMPAQAEIIVRIIAIARELTATT